MALASSILIALAGSLVSGVTARSLRRKNPLRDQRHYWILGVAALLPAWLMAFLRIIQPASAQAVDVPLPPPAILSSGAGLLGVIATDYLFRRVLNPRPGTSAVIHWLVGWVTLLPALIILLARL
jgi:hypothetical protein